MYYIVLYESISLGELYPKIDNWYKLSPYRMRKQDGDKDMANDTYVECLVATKPSAVKKFLKVLLTMLAAAFLFLGLLGYIFAMIIGIVFGVLAYIVAGQISVEYEYLYLDREISIDRITGKSKRKRVGTYEVERMEVLAPIKSYHLDNYGNREMKAVDYSTGIENQPDTRYVMYYEGSQKIILEPSPEFVQAVMNVAPRKVFKD